MSASWVFDQSHYDALNTARSATLERLLPELKKRLELKTALDLGCGLGYYSQILHGCGFDVLGVDGRDENIEEAKRRYPHLRFQVADAQDPTLSNLGSFDLVFCFGLLYHLENPFRVVRTLAALSAKVTLIEGIVYPSPEPVMVLMNENMGEDQGLNFMAFYPSEACLVKMLRSSGLAACYTPDRSPDHPEYATGSNGFRRRTVLAAAKAPIDSPLLIPMPDPSTELSPWAMMPLYPARGRTSRVYGFFDRLLYGKTRRRNRE